MKSLRLFLAAILITITVFQSRPAKAAVGAFVSVPVLITGIVITGGTYIFTDRAVRRCGSDGLCGLGWLFAAPVMLVGIVVLDGEQEVQFQELSPKQAQTLGVSASELATYNTEVDQANMLLADVKAELSKIDKPSAEDSKRVWSEMKDFVSPKTFITMQKIVSQK